MDKEKTFPHIKSLTDTITNSETDCQLNPYEVEGWLVAHVGDTSPLTEFTRRTLRTAIYLRAMVEVHRDWRNGVVSVVRALQGYVDGSIDVTVDYQAKKIGNA